MLSYSLHSFQCRVIPFADDSAQVLLSTDDLKMMVRDANSSDSSQSPGTVNLQTFISIMENSSW
jgi:hypothetical protein